jgi:hypothetical protein
VVGGGNSAGQAAVFLSETARKVYMLVRGADLAHSKAWAASSLIFVFCWRLQGLALIELFKSISVLGQRTKNRLGRGLPGGDGKSELPRSN